jgi:delta24-sterol reductase
MSTVSLTSHLKKLQAIQAQVRNFAAANQQVRVYHGNTNSTRYLKAGTPRVDISMLNDILEINTKKRYALIEANVPLDKLLDATLAFGLMPPVVSEFPGITIGGAVQGGAGESSSFRYGCIHETALEYEVVLGDGSLVTASESQNPELFTGLPCSCGTLGLLTMIKLKLVPTKPYVRLKYERLKNSNTALKRVRALVKTDVDFVDGLVFSGSKTVLMSGVFSEAVDLPQATFHRRRDDWFYLHADKVTHARAYYEELIPIKEYLFRYDIGGFWVASDGMKLLHIPFNRISRFIGGGLFTTRNLYRFLHGSGLSQRFMVQDICLPQKAVLDYLKFVDSSFAIYPLWLCPLRPDNGHPLSPTNLRTKLVINVGTWGDLAQDYEKSIRNNRRLERFVSSVGGRKVFYAQAFYTAKAFWMIYDRLSYDHLRAKYKAQITFPNVYQKVTINAPQTPSVRRGWVALVKQPLR